jgi:RNA recognition motif-containing protein
LKSRGFGFITFATQAEAMVAIQTMNNLPFDGRPLRVNLANESRQQFDSRFYHMPYYPPFFGQAPFGQYPHAYPQFVQPYQYQQYPPSPIQYPVVFMLPNQEPSEPPSESSNTE